MRIYKISKERYDKELYPRSEDSYLDIGHNASQSNQVYLWAIDRNGALSVLKASSVYPEHGSGKEDLNIRNSICQGRYEEKSGKCSIAYLDRVDMQKTSATWVKGILKDKFPNISQFYEYETFNARAKNGVKIYKIAKAQVNKEKLGSYSGYEVYLVSEEDIRNIKLEYEEFTNFAIHDQFESLIPKNEIWIGKEVSEGERKFFINNAVKLYNLINSGVDIAEAYDKALMYEKSLREKSCGIKRSTAKSEKNPPKELYVEQYGKIGNDITVWIVNGKIVRDLYKTDYVEGGHGFIYSWIPKNEIWIEKDIEEDEMPFILYHEYVELKLMRDKDMDYEDAHEIAAKKEFEMRKEKSK
jgi:hypothetical protein